MECFLRVVGVVCFIYFEFFEVLGGSGFDFCIKWEVEVLRVVEVGKVVVENEKLLPKAKK